jgi:hypothetical protein
VRVEYKPALQCRGCDRWYIEGFRMMHWHRIYHGCRGDPPLPRSRKRNNQFKANPIESKEQ